MIHTSRASPAVLLVIGLPILIGNAATIKDPIVATTSWRALEGIMTVQKLATPVAADALTVTTVHTALRRLRPVGAGAGLVTARFRIRKIVRPLRFLNAGCQQGRWGDGELRLT
jgi:hypothetical protein